MYVTDQHAPPHCEQTKVYSTVELELVRVVITKSRDLLLCGHHVCTAPVDVSANPAS